MCQQPQSHAECHNVWRARQAESAVGLSGIVQIALWLRLPESSHAPNMACGSSDVAVKLTGSGRAASKSCCDVRSHTSQQQDHQGDRFTDSELTLMILLLRCVAFDITSQQAVDNILTYAINSQTHQDQYDEGAKFTVDRQ